MLINDLAAELALPVVGGTSGPGLLAEIGHLTNRARAAARSPSGDSLRRYDELRIGFGGNRAQLLLAVRAREILGG